MQKRDKIVLGVLVGVPVVLYLGSMVQKKQQARTTGYSNATGDLFGLLDSNFSRAGTSTTSSGTMADTVMGTGGVNTGKNNGLAAIKNKADRFQGINTGKNTLQDPGQNELDSLQKELEDLMNFKPTPKQPPAPVYGNGSYPAYDPGPAPASGLDLSSIDFKTMFIWGGVGIAAIWLGRKLYLNYKAKAK